MEGGGVVDLILREGDGEVVVVGGVVRDPRAENAKAAGEALIFPMCSAGLLLGGGHYVCARQCPRGLCWGLLCVLW